MDVVGFPRLSGVRGLPLPRVLRGLLRRSLQGAARRGLVHAAQRDPPQLPQLGPARAAADIRRPALREGCRRKLIRNELRGARTPSYQHEIPGNHRSHQRRGPPASRWSALGDGGRRAGRTDPAVQGVVAALLLRRARLAAVRGNNAACRVLPDALRARDPREPLGGDLRGVQLTRDPDRAWFLVGTDLVKDRTTLEAAYNDSAGVTADFNKNVLAVLSTELDADFDLDAFEHVARWDHENLWVDIRLRSLANQVVNVRALDMQVAFSAGEEMRTEISTKFARPGLEGIYAEAA